jgi:hypothetical protein
MYSREAHTGQGSTSLLWFLTFVTVTWIARNTMSAEERRAIWTHWRITFCASANLAFVPRVVSGNKRDAIVALVPSAFDLVRLAAHPEEHILQVGPYHS